MTPHVTMLALAMFAGLASTACSRPEAGEANGEAMAPPAADTVSRDRIERHLRSAFARAAALSDSIDEVLRPFPLLTPGEEAGLRRYSSAAQLERARELGTHVTAAASIDSLVAAGRLVPLEDSTALWVVHELEHSVAFVTPDTRTLVADIAERFQERLAGLGLPAFRLEITSVLRTPELQQALRGENPNAARGASTHEFGTTVDISYSVFAAPAPSAAAADTVLAGASLSWLDPYIERMAAYALDAIAARKSRELKAVLGHVLADLQNDGAVMVTLERQQPVYHLTVARAR